MPAFSAEGKGASPWGPVSLRSCWETALLCFYAFGSFAERTECGLNAALSMRAGEGAPLCLVSAPAARTQPPVCDGCCEHRCRGSILFVSRHLFCLGLLCTAGKGAAVLPADMRNCLLLRAAWGTKYEGLLLAGKTSTFLGRKSLRVLQSLTLVVLTQQDS